MCHCLLFCASTAQLGTLVFFYINGNLIFPGSGLPEVCSFDGSILTHSFHVAKLAKSLTAPIIFGTDTKLCISRLYYCLLFPFSLTVGPRIFRNMLRSAIKSFPSFFRLFISRLYFCLRSPFSPTVGCRIFRNMLRSATKSFSSFLIVSEYCLKLASGVVEL